MRVLMGSDLSPIEGILKKYGGASDNLISVLQEAQEIYGYLPEDVLCAIAEGSGSSLARIKGVATFYTQFRLTPIGRYLIMLCKGTACHVNGADLIETAICNELQIENSETTSDGLFTLENVACLGCCSLSPVMMINGETYGSLTPDKAVAVLRELKKRALKEKK